MADLLKTGSAWLEAQRHEHMSSTVTYRRGGDSVELSATVGRTRYESADDHGLIVKSEARDYLLRASDLILGGSTTTPERGDRIEETIGASVYSYEPFPLGGEPLWRYSDPLNETIRIHTRHVSTA